MRNVTIARKQRIPYSYGILFSSLQADAVRRKPKKREERIVLQDPNGSRVSLGESEAKNQQKQQVRSKPPPAPRTRPTAAAAAAQSRGSPAREKDAAAEREQSRRAAGRPPRASRSRDDLDAGPREKAAQKKQKGEAQGPGLKRRSHTDSDLSAAEDERRAPASFPSRAPDDSGTHANHPSTP